MATLRVEAASVTEPGGDIGGAVWDERPDRGWRRCPVRFGWGDAMREAVEVLDRWPGEDKCDFRVRGDDGAIYILRHHERDDRWQLLFFDRDAQR